MAVLSLSTYQSLTAFYLTLIIGSLWDLFDTCYGLDTTEGLLSLLNFTVYGVNEFLLLYFLYTGCSYGKVLSLTEISLNYINNFVLQGNYFCFNARQKYKITPNRKLPKISKQKMFQLHVLELYFPDVQNKFLRE